jgi:phospholipase/carboxylesterase
VTDFSASSSASPNLAIDDDLIVWSVARDDLPARLPDRPLVIVMHGRGSHENDLPGLFPYLPTGAVYASLRAPRVSPAPIVDGFEWFTSDVAASPTLGGIGRAADAVLAWLGRVQASVGAPSAVAVMGFSQGGAMATHLLRLEPERFVAAVNLSGFSIPGELPGDAWLAGHKPPLFWGRDPADPVLPPVALERTDAFVPGHFSVTDAPYPGIGHSISTEELDDVSAFLTRVLGLGLGLGLAAD